MNGNSQIAILLGAGSSLPAEFPSTQSLTDKVLSGDGGEDIQTRIITLTKISRLTK